MVCDAGVNEDEGGKDTEKSKEKKLVGERKPLNTQVSNEGPN